MALYPRGSVRCLWRYSLRLWYVWFPTELVTMAADGQKDTGTISGIQEMDFWQNEFAKPGETQPSPGETSLIVSILSVGTFVGALSAGILSDITGRKWGIIVSTMIPFNLGVALQTAATEQTMFVLGRLFAGIGVGLVSAQIPMFQSETLPKWIRGAVVGLVFRQVIMQRRHLLLT